MHKERIHPLANKGCDHHDAIGTTFIYLSRFGAPGAMPERLSAPCVTSLHQIVRLKIAQLNSSIVLPGDLLSVFSKKNSGIVPFLFG